LIDEVNRIWNKLTPQSSYEENKQKHLAIAMSWGWQARNALHRLTIWPQGVNCLERTLHPLTAGW